MKHQVLLSIFILSMLLVGGCSRYYGIKKPLPETSFSKTHEPAVKNAPVTVSIEPKQVDFYTMVDSGISIQPALQAELVSPVQEKTSNGNFPPFSSKSQQPAVNNKHDDGTLISIPIPWAEEDLKMDGMAVAGFVTGIVGLFIFGYILGAIAIIFSAISLSRIKKKPEIFKGKGLATTGLILGIVDIVLLTIILLAL